MIENTKLCMMKRTARFVPQAEALALLVLTTAIARLASEGSHTALQSKISEIR